MIFKLVSIYGKIPRLFYRKSHIPILKIIDIADVECDFELYNLIPGPLSNNIIVSTS